jgi:Mg-chelatase subunit ChlD
MVTERFEYGQHSWACPGSCRLLLVIFGLIGVTVALPGIAGATPVGTTHTGVDTGSHVQVAGLEVTFARSVSADHRAIEPTEVFSEADRTIFMAFFNDSQQWVRADVAVYAVDVEGVKANAPYWTGAWVHLPPGVRHSVSLNGPEGGLIPGTYRVEINAGGTRQTTLIEVEPLYPFALRKSEANLEVGYNIALHTLGGRIEQASQWDDEGWSARHLNDGLTWVRSPDTLDRCVNCGWSSREGDRQAEVVLSFHEQREAEIAAVVIDTRIFLESNRRIDEQMASLPKHIAVYVSSESPISGFEHVATARLRWELQRQIIPLPDGTRGRFLKLEVLKNFGARSVVIAEVGVIERDSRKRSIVEDAEIDLANVASGGVLVRYTGYADGQSAANLFDSEGRGTGWLSNDRYFPQDFTIAFKNDHLALVDKVRLTLSPKAPDGSWPSEVAIALSQRSPLDGFVEIERFPVEKRAGSQTFTVGQEARFVKVRLLDNHGADRTSLGEIAVIEGRRDGYTPVLLRDTPMHLIKQPNQEKEEKIDEDTVPEIEPNDEAANANTLPLNGKLRGEINPLGEVDFFALPVFESEASALTLNYSGRPYIRHGLSLLDGSGSVISHFDPGDLPASDARLTFALSGAEKYLKLTEPPASVVVIWDTSGSMHGSEKDLERAVREYIRRAPPHQQINLIRFSSDVEVLLHAFTSDKTRLQAAIDDNVQPKGGTRLYDAILEGMKLLVDIQGNRAIVVMTDGEDNGQTWHDAFWRQIDRNRIRLYTIGLGHGLKHYAYAYATSGERILRHLAMATDGAAFFTLESSALRDFYKRIADQLSHPATYFLTPTVERGYGKLRLVATAEQVPSAAMPAVHLIYDLSGSMSERGSGGQLKYVMAQNAIYAALDSLPDGAPFGFTVYGARIPEKAGKDKACTDIVTLQKLGPLDKQAVKDFVAKRKPKGGTTPLVRSVRHVAEDFAGKNGGIIIAVTDGIEECDPDPIATIDELKGGKLQYLELNVVGFALQDPEAREMMETIAKVGGGRYFDAADTDALAQALKEAMAAKYTVRDAANRAVASGTIDGGDITVPAGFYRVDIAAADAPIQTRDVRIDHDHVTTVRVNKVGSEVDVAVDVPYSLEKMRQARRECGAAAADRDPAERTRRVQEKLNQLGFEVGRADNQVGPQTRRGIRAFQERFGLPVSPEVSLLLEQHLDCVISIGEVFLATADTGQEN